MASSLEKFENNVSRLVVKKNTRLCVYGMSSTYRDIGQWMIRSYTNISLFI